MTLQQLQYLVAIAETNSINQAAQSLFVSQSSISKAIKQLEEELGFTLMERNYRGIAFTPRGLEFLRDAYALMDRFDFLKAHYLSAPNDSVSFSVSSQHYIFVLEAISQMVNLLGEHNYSISLREHKTSEIINDVATGRSRIGFVFYYHLNEEFIKRELERYNLAFHPFCSAMPHAYVADNHPLAGEELVTQAQLDEYPYVCYDLGTDHGNFAEEIFSPAHPTKVIYVFDRCSMFNIIKHSNGYTTGSGFLSRGYLEENVVTIPLDVPPSNMMYIGWIWPRGRELDAESEQFIQFCKEALDKCYTGDRKNNTKPVLGLSDESQ